MSTEKSTQDTRDRQQHRVEVVKGDLTDAQKAALEQVVGSVADAVEREHNAKPDTRGHFGTPAVQPARNTENPTGFRSAPLPRR